MPQGPKSSLSGATLLLHSEDTSYRDNLARDLRDLGYLVFEVRTRAETIDAVTRYSPSMAFLHVSPPRPLAFQVAEWLSRESQCAIAFLGDSSERDVLTRAIKAGSHAFLSTPVSVQDLLTTTEIVLARWTELRELQAAHQNLIAKSEQYEDVHLATGFVMATLSISRERAMRLLAARSHTLNVEVGHIACQILLGDLDPRRL